MYTLYAAIAKQNWINCNNSE